ncbi:MAG: hypothetical protein WC689_03945 [Methylocystis sp.]|jgi:hypothetical protein
MDWVLAHWAALIGPAVVAAVVSALVAIVVLLVNRATTFQLHRDKLQADQGLAERKFEFDKEIAERKFKYDRDLHDHKRRVELAEAILADFYQMDDVIRSIRSPAAFAGEAAERTRGENELEDEARQRDTYFVPIARLTKHSEFISALMSKRYRSRAVLGYTMDEAFRLIHEVISRIQVSATTLTNMINRGRVTRGNQALWDRCEADIWYGLADEDPLEPIVKRAISIAEEVCRPVLEADCLARTSSSP